MGRTDQAFLEVTIFVFKGFSGTLDAAVILAFALVIFTLLFVLLAEVCIPAEQLLWCSQLVVRVKLVSNGARRTSTSSLFALWEFFICSNRCQRLAMELSVVRLARGLKLSDMLGECP